MAFNLGNFDLGGLSNITGFESSFDVPMTAPAAPAVSMVAPQQVAPVTADTGYIPTVFGGIKKQEYGAAPAYEKPEEALSNWGNFLTDLKTKQAQTASKYNLMNYDPGDFARAGYSGVSAPASQAGVDLTVDYITKNKIPVSKEIDGQTYYLTTGVGETALAKTLGDEYKAKGSYEAYGEPGTYSTVYVEPESVFDNPVLQIVGMLAPPIGMVTTAAKVASGESVSPIELAGAALTGLQMGGVIRPPQGVAEGIAGPADPGKGLFGLDYGQTTGLVRAAASGNLEEGVVQAFGAPLVQDAINKININVGGAANLGVQPDDLAVGLNQTIASLAGGADLKDALLDGGLTYLQEGGSLPDAIAEPIKAAGNALKEVVGDVGSFLDDTVFQNIKDIAPDLSGVEDVFREVGSTAEDVVRAGGTALEPVVDPVVEAAKPVIAAVEEKAPAIEDAARAAGSKIDDVLNPFYDILKGAVGGMLGGQLAQAGQAQQQVASPTRTTDSLFGDELFRFKTQVGSEMPELVKLQRRYQA